MRAPLLALLLLFVTALGPALAQDVPAPAQDTDTRDPTPPGTLDPKPLPPLANPNSPTTPAKQLFGRKTEPLPGPARSIGGYADGCLAGGVALPITGPAWQVMRLSRNRNWGNPELIAFLERLRQQRQEGRLERPVGRRHVAAARRPDDHRPRQPSDRARCRYLVHADARPCADARGARVQRRGRHGRGRTGSTSIQKSGRHERTELISTAAEDPAVTAHLRQCGDQEGDVPRGRIGPRLAREGAAVVGPCRAFPCPHRLSGRQPAMQAATAGAGRAMAAAMSSITGSRNRRLHPKPPPVRRSRSRR